MFGIRFRKDRRSDVILAFVAVLYASIVFFLVYVNPLLFRWPGADLSTWHFKGFRSDKALIIFLLLPALFVLILMAANRFMGFRVEKKAILFFSFCIWMLTLGAIFYAALIHSFS
jgi:hypothetical protein